MSKEGLDAKLLHDLILASTKANESMKNSLGAMSASLETIADNSVQTREFIEAIQTEKRTFYKYTVRTFLWIFVVLIAIIGGLLWDLNMKGADRVSDAAKAAGKLMPF